MGDPNKTVISQSSPKHLISGNNENESENQRNLQQKNKHFMSPTISTASKFTATPTSNKKVLTEWKSSPKSDLGKLGNSNSSLRKSLPKIPHKQTDDNAVFVADSLDIPYDPLTNYLSPRPRFLRYRPNRRREIAVPGEEKSGTDSGSDSESLRESVNSSSEKKVEESVVIDEENEDVDELEDCIEEKNRGLKWELLKGLIVIFAVFFCTIWICSMNSSAEKRQELMSIRIDDVYGMNMSLRIVSLSSVDSRMGVIEINDFAVDSDEKLGEISESVVAQEIENLETMESLDDYFQRDPRFRNEDYYFEDGDVEFEVDNVGDEGNEVPDLKTKYEQIETEAPIVASDEDDDSEAKFRGMALEVMNMVPESETKYEQEAPIVALVLNDGTELENEDSESKFRGVVLGGINVDDGKSGVPKSKTEDEPVKKYAPIIASELNEGPGRVDDHSQKAITVENEAHFDKGIVQSELKIPASEDSDRAIEEETGVDSETEIEVSEANETVESEPKLKETLLKLTFSDLIWPVISPLIALGLLASLCFKFYCKCKRTSSKTRSSNVKLCSSVGMNAKSKLGLPPKAVEKTDYSQLNAPLVQKGVHSEVKLPSSINPQEDFEKSLQVIIPTVKQLGEFEVAIDLTRSLKSYSVKSKMEDKDETVFTTPDTKRVLRRSSIAGQPSSSELSTAESYSCGSYISQERTSLKGGKEEVTRATPTPRRSTRLRNKGVTSP